MAANLAVDTRIGLRRSTNNDPLNDWEQRLTRDVLLADFMLIKPSPLGMLFGFESQLRTIGIQKMITLFPEKSFGVLKLAEFVAHYVAFTLHDLNDFSNFPELYGVPFAPVMQSVADMLTEVVKLLHSASRVDEEAFRHVVTQFERIRSAFYHWRNYIFNRVRGCCPIWLRSDDWQPHKHEYYSIPQEKSFMMNLRQIFIESHSTDGRVTLEKLVDILSLSDLDYVLGSEVRTNTAIQILTLTVVQAVRGNRVVNDAEIQLRCRLFFYCARLNSPTNFSLAVSVCFKKLAERRIERIHNYLFSSYPSVM